LKNTNNIS